MLPNPRLLALAAGAAAATGFAPLDLWPLTLAAFALLVRLLIDAPGWKQAFVRAWLFGWAHFTIGLNWIAHAFTYQDAMPHWLGYPAVALLSAYLALFPGLAGLVAYAFAPSSRAQSRAARKIGRASTSLGLEGTRMALAFAGAWIVSEWLRAVLFTGFAWNPLAAIWAPIEPVARVASWTGTLGLSGLTALAAAGIALAAANRSAGAALIAPLALLPLFHLSGGTATSGKAVRIVQPNTSVDTKYAPGAGASNVRRLIRLSGTAGEGPRLILWPEGALDPFLVEEDSMLRASLSRMLGPGDMLLTGGDRLEYGANDKVVGARNAVFALGPDGRIKGRYDKAHLVPWGEYLPMRGLTEWLGLARLVPGDIDFWPGPGPASLNIPGFGRVGLQICYEIIFSGAVASPTARPDMLFNPSNDAWFGSWGSPQFLAQTRLRAVEEGLPVIRATPTGISALVSPDGTVLASIPLATEGAIDAVLPAPLPPTLFSRFGNLLPLCLALILGGIAIAMRRRSR